MTQGTVCLITPPSVFLLDERVFMKGDMDGGYRFFVYNPAGVPLRYEHSMGQLGGQLPATILWTTRERRPPHSAR